MTIPRHEPERWLAQARKIAAELKARIHTIPKDPVNVGIAFDDGVVTINIDKGTLERLETAELAGLLFGLVLQDSDHRAAGESAGAQAQGAPGECGHAAPPVPAGASSSSSGDGETAAAAVSERCSVKDGEEQCQNQAAGGLRINLYATQTIQRRYGRRVMLTLIMDLPVCLGCMSKITPNNLMTDEQWRAFSRVAQQRNSGVLADRSQTEIVLCKFDDPEYQALRAQIAKQQTKSQPGPAGPQQGAGDGR
ncbi:MAG: hypothetical protein EPO20_14625 [Betaproteobacteria bacterium]|nr:MAG: hypothetical protein EPO20_14625 [Betaproteobacteria bacterium]